VAECIFCRIAQHQAPADIVAEDDLVLAFRDIQPKARVHILVIPKRHVASLNDMTAADEPLLGRLVQTARAVAAEQGIADDGYKLAISTGVHGGQSVPHVHVHLLGGEPVRGISDI